MGRQKKILLWFAGTLSLLVIILFILGVLAPTLINKESVKEEIISILSRKLKGRIDFQKVDIFVFPRPNVKIYQARLSFQEKAEGNMESVQVYPELIPLIFGHVKISKIRIESPDFSISLPKREEPFSVAEIEKNVLTVCNDLLSIGPALVIVMKKGMLKLSMNNQNILELKDVDSRVILQPQESKLTLNCSSDFSRSVLLMAHFHEANHSITNVSLDVEGSEIDVPLARETAFSLAGGAPIIQDIFTYIRDGKVPFISFRSKGESISSLGKSENILIKGKMHQGGIFIPGPNLDFKDVEGECIISKGILDGENIEARLGNAIVRQGKLKVGLAGKDAPLHLETLTKVDIKELSYLLKQLVKDEAFLKELNGIQDIKGNAEGKLILGETLSSIKPQVDVSSFNLAATYQRTPYPIEIKEGQFLYDGKKVQVKNLNGAVGRSTFSGLTAGLTVRSVPYLEILSGKSSISLQEIHHMLLSFKKLHETLKHITALNGNIALSSINFKGPVVNPQEWQFKVIGSAENINIQSSQLPGTLIVTRGKFKCTPEQLVFTDAQVNILDASHTVSGMLRSPLKGFQNADIVFNGTVGAKAAQWIKDSIKLPALKAEQKFSFSRSHVVWVKSGNVLFQGNVKVQDGPNIFIDVIKNPQELKINKLFLNDGVSRATLTCNLTANTIGLSFVGKLNGITLAKLINALHVPEGFIEGNFNTEIDLGKPLVSKAQGILSGKKIVIPWQDIVPLTIENFSLKAERNRIDVASALITVEDNSFSLQGILNFAEKGLSIDMDIATDRLVWESIKKLVEKERGTQKKDYLRKLPLLGILHLKSNSFIYKTVNVSPLNADILFFPDTISISITKAFFCGISTSGKVQISNDNLQLDLNPDARGQELKPTLDCLSDYKSVITGRFDFSGSLTTHGKSDQLIPSLGGKLDFSSKDGRIYKATLLAKIFSLINVTGIFQGGLPDLVKEGYSYHSLTLRGDIENGNILLKEAILDAPSMQIVATGNVDLAKKKIDVKALASPLKPVNTILRNIPIVKNIVGPNFVSIPIKIEGDLENPKVDYLPLSSVGAGLLGIVERIIKLPATIIQPLIPGENKNHQDTGKKD